MSHASVQSLVQWFLGFLENVVAPRRGSLWVLLCSLGATSMLLYLLAFREFPQRNFTSLWRDDQRIEYTLYTGPKGGRFSSLGMCVGAQLKGREAPFGLKLEPTSGSLDNAQRIATTRRAFGFVGEQTGGNKVFLSPRVQLVTPLYMQKAQVLYRRDAWSKFGSGDLRLTERLDDPTRSFFQNAIVDVGPSGSGTQLVASYLLSTLGVQPLKTRSSENFDDQISALKQEKGLEAEHADVAIMFAGDVEGVTSALANKAARVGVASIDPTVGAALRRSFSFEVIPTTFAESAVSTITTLGAYAWLMASADVPPRHLEIMVDRLAHECGLPENAHLQLVQKSYHEQAAREASELLTAGLEFVLLTALLTWVVYAIFVSSLSAWRRTHHIRAYGEIRRDLLDLRSKLLRRELRSKEALAKLATRADQVSDEAMAIEIECQNGALTVTHRDRLAVWLDLLRREIVTLCAHCLELLVQRHQNNAEAVLEELDAWMARGYLSIEQHARWANLLSPTDPISKRMPRPSEHSDS